VNARNTGSAPRAPELVVTAGKDIGKRCPVTTTPVLVGRARDVDLALTDLTVSRHHLSAELVGDRLRVSVSKGASTAHVNGEERTTADLQVGEMVTIGETSIKFVDEGKTAASDSVEISDVATLLGGITEDTRGFAAIFALVEELDRNPDRAGVEETIKTWGRRHLTARSVEWIVASSSNQVVVQKPLDGGDVRLSVPLPEIGALTFILPATPAGIAEHQRRLAVIAGRVAASTLASLTRLQRVEEENASLRALALGSAHAFLGDSLKAREIAKLLPRLAAADSSILLLGETGSGKSFVARLIHESSRRAAAPFRALNCAAIPEALVESEIFGYERGAFTGATNARAGAFESAGEGTLFLDEIGELSLASQAKLLRAIEERTFERLGSNKPIALKARVLAATNRDLQAMMAEERFRADLFYRLSVVTLTVPPLRERREDLPLLAQQLLADLAPSANRRVDGFTKEALEVIRRYEWPGNVRELRNAIERALVLGDSSWIEPADLPDVVRGAPAMQPANETDVLKLPARLDELEERAIQAALAASGGNRTRAAAILGINRVTLYKKLREEPK
jgi:DNA-binding NtrC family response regulator